MIYLQTARQQLSSLEQFGLQVLLDFSRLIEVLTPGPNIVELALTEREESDAFRVEGAPGRIYVSRAALRRAGGLAAAKVEQESREADRHGRVPSRVNPLVQEGQSQIPLLNTWAGSFRQAVIQWSDNRPVRMVAPWPEGHRWAAAFTHDVDVVSLWPLFTTLRLLELGKKRELRQALRVARSAAASLFGDPVTRGVDQLLTIERELGIASTWFVLAGTASFRSTVRGDVTYSVESSRARHILSSIVADGHEIGLHGSFATMEDGEAMAAERERLQAASGVLVNGVRQHFLRMRPGATQRVMHAAGFAYDATYGFPDRNGFRLGVADVVPAWDAQRKTLQELEEAPLIWMDRAQSKYSGIEDPVRWVDEGIELARTCQKEEGLWVGLWHPNLDAALGFPGAVTEYRRLAKTIAGERPFIASLGAITAWRQARRSVHARSVSNEGVPAFGATIASSWPLIIEDSHGAVVSRLPWPETA